MKRGSDSKTQPSDIARIWRYFRMYENYVYHAVPSCLRCPGYRGPRAPASKDLRYQAISIRDHRRRESFLHSGIVHDQKGVVV
jgi:hypothetical protein